MARNTGGGRLIGAKPKTTARPKTAARPTATARPKTRPTATARPKTSQPAPAPVHDGISYHPANDAANR